MTQVQGADLRGVRASRAPVNGSGASEIARRARNHRRRFARRLGVRTGALDALTTERLRSWAIAAARLEIDGATDARSTELWWRAHNATSRALRRLEERIRELGLDHASANGRGGAVGALEAHLREHYSTDRHDGDRVDDSDGQEP